MYPYLSSYEVPVLLSRGFTFGISDEILWGKSNDGREFQVLDDGQWLKFGERRQNGGVNPHHRMSRLEFDALFPG